jgi:hypothetical protein
VLPFEKVPVAANCCVAPAKIDALIGVTVIETSTGAVTVRLVEPLVDASAAPMLVVPCDSVVARPDPPIVATFVADDDQVTELERSAVLPSV